MKKKNILKKIFFLICLFFFNMQISDRFSIYVKFIKTKIEIYKIRNFLKFCSITKRIIKEFSKINEPKISIISAIYNREKFLTTVKKK